MGAKKRGLVPIEYWHPFLKTLNWVARTRHQSSHVVQWIQLVMFWDGGIQKAVNFTVNQ